MEDKRIVELYFQRDESAIQQTSEKYGSRLRQIAWKITEDRMAAEECENDTYLQAWNMIPPHEPVSYLFAFLARITRHISLDICRNRSRLKRKAFLVELSLEMEQCIPSPDDTQGKIEGILLGKVISDFLRKLPEEKRKVFIRRYWYLDSISAIAERYDIKESKIKTMLFRTRNELRCFLEKEGYLL